MVPPPMQSLGIHRRHTSGLALHHRGRPHQVEDKRTGYAAVAIPEYWRFDETGEFHGTNLDGDRLVEGRYDLVPIETLEHGVLQGYSSVLNLFIRWENGELRWHDPDTEQHIMTFEQERDRAEAAETRADASEARVRELEAELARRNRESQRTSQPIILQKRGLGTTFP